VHYGLLKYLFVRSFEPYWEFIKSWIYQAKLNDPYEEYFLAWSDGIAISHSFLALEDELSHVEVSLYIHFFKIWHLIEPCQVMLCGLL
jgi:hypothetical protein